MPRIKTTPTVRVALWALRVYLLILLALIAVKFVRVFSQSRNERKQTTAHSPSQDESKRSAP